MKYQSQFENTLLESHYYIIYTNELSFISKKGAFKIRNFV